MPLHPDNERWLLDTADATLRRRAGSGEGVLTPHERLLLCLWAADYGMRNAGDLRTAEDLHPGFSAEARALADVLGLDHMRAVFSLPVARLEAQYFDRFEALCDELRGGWPAAPAAAGTDGERNELDDLLDRMIQDSQRLAGSRAK